MINYLRIIFAGTPEVALQHLALLLNIQKDKKYKIVGVLTKPDRPVGRGYKLIFNPVKMLAQKFNIPIFQPTPTILKTKESHQWIANRKADIMIVIAYGLILPKSILHLFPLGCLNVHYSLLPRWRGSTPIQSAIYAGDKETGITIIQMDNGIDTGDILYKVSCPIESKDTSATLYQKLLNIGHKALQHTIDLLTSSQIKIKPEKQNNELANYAKKLNKNDGLIDWTLPAEQIERCVRAFNPWPVSYFMIDNQPIKVWASEVIQQTANAIPGTILDADNTGIKVATAEWILNILQVQPASKKIMLSSDFLNSRYKSFITGKNINTNLTKNR